MKRLLLSDIVQPSVLGDTDFFSRKANAGDFEGLMDPVIGINHFEATGTAIETYVHKGISEIFYVFEGSAPYQTIDANGDKTIIAPGSLLWFWGGRGMGHSEAPVHQGNKVEGIQLFLDIPQDKKKYEPVTISIKADEIPNIKNEGVTVKVVCGSTVAAACKAETPQKLTILEISLEAGKEYLHVLPANWSGTVFALEGRLDAMTAEETLELDEGMVISMAYSEYNEPVRFTGLTSAKLLFISGEPVQETAPSPKMAGREPHLVSAGISDIII